MTAGSSRSPWVVTPVRVTDHAVWEQLYREYSEFYEVEPTQLGTVWSWLHDATHEVNGLVVRASAEGDAVGLAHYRPFARPLSGTVGCWLDDLYVAPAARGTGAVDALLAALQTIAGEQGWSTVRWFTRQSNARARSTYERLGTRTEWVTYELAPTSGAGGSGNVVGIEGE